MRRSTGQGVDPSKPGPARPVSLNSQVGKGGGWVGLTREQFRLWLRKREAERIADGTQTAYRSPEGNAS